MMEMMGGDVAAVATALAAAQGEIEPAEKDRQNPHFKSHYATISAVWAAIRGPLSKHGMAVVQMPRAEDNAVHVRTVLLHKSGGWLASECSAIAKDASPQAVGSVITYLRRYGLAAMVGVVADDDDDAADGQQQGVRRAPQRAPGPEPEPVFDGPLPLHAQCSEKQAQFIRKLVKSHVITEEERAGILARLDGERMSKQRARDAIEWLTTEIDAREELERQEKEEAGA